LYVRESGIKLKGERSDSLILKPRQVSDELKLMRILNARMELEEKDKQNYLNLEKGYKGELIFDTLMENLIQERLILNDLLL
jgi:hypothetical protein